MSAFDTAMRTLFSDPNLAIDAVFIPQVGQSATVRVVTRTPDVFQNVGSSVIETPTLMLEVQVASCPDLIPGDQFMIDDTLYTVQGEPRRDIVRLTWQVDLYAS
jgi:hypothetical protein